GDFKLDPTPVVGASFDQRRLLGLAREPVLCMVSDSTNADLPGCSGSEQSLRASLRGIVSECPGRVIVTCFSSNIARFQTLAEVAADTGRCVGLLGRSLRRTAAIGRALGYFTPTAELVEERHAGLVPAENLLALVTGSQGEPGAALHRLANDMHPSLDLEPGDSVVFSSRAIPGNEPEIDAIKQRLARRGIAVFEHGLHHTHVSGHPAQEELRRMYGWIKPLSVLAVHGSTDKLRANAALAASCHVPVQRTARDGELLRLESAGLEALDRVPVGRLMVGGRGLERVR
ncbi:MAG: ribonuclease J, partial [Gammaproteobacteria bacterium]|nr:ribonuclease J [Gammaproteobacteria bacterium]